MAPAVGKEEEEAPEEPAFSEIMEPAALEVTAGPAG